LKRFIINILQGIIIGIANIVPGVSGASLAFILGVYQNIINITTRLDLHLLKLIFTGQFKKIKDYISLQFLSAVSIGIVISFITLARILEYLLNHDHFEILTWSYFFGIIIGSIYYISQFISKWRLQEWLYFILGLIISLSMLFIEPSEENKNLVFIFLCGIIGAIGMITPGLSGSYILELLGNFELLLVDTITHLTSFNFDNNYLDSIGIFIIFLIGQLVGLILFSRVIKWLIQTYKNITFSLISGFITGSLIHIWPWQKKSNDLLINNLEIPEITTQNIYAGICIFIGIISIVFIERLASKIKDV
jgi:putative membrane protein